MKKLPSEKCFNLSSKQNGFLFSKKFELEGKYKFTYFFTLNVLSYYYDNVSFHHVCQCYLLVIRQKRVESLSMIEM